MIYWLGIILGALLVLYGILADKTDEPQWMQELQKRVKPK